MPESSSNRRERVQNVDPLAKHKLDMGFSVMDGDGNVTSKMVQWGEMMIDVMTITDVDEDLDPEATSVLVMTMKTLPDGKLEMGANIVEMYSTALASKVHERALGYLAENRERAAKLKAAQA